jgi:hypothetical protein
MQTTTIAAATVTAMADHRLRMKEPDNIDDKDGIEHLESRECDDLGTSLAIRIYPFGIEQQAFGDGMMVARSFPLKIRLEVWMRNTN